VVCGKTYKGKQLSGKIYESKQLKSSKQVRFRSTPFETNFTPTLTTNLLILFQLPVPSMGDHSSLEQSGVKISA